VLRDRVAGIEAQLVARGSLDVSQLNQEPGRDDRAAEREAFVAHLMQNLLGEQQAKGTR
jgi:hypothetical protein